VADEPILSESLRQAVTQLAVHPDDVHVLGIEPDIPDEELGYIVPKEDDGHVSFGVKNFVEKPAVAQARELIGRGGLWNSFILVARVQALLDLFTRRIPEIVMEMREIVRLRAQHGNNYEALVDLYDRLPNIDFSHHIMRGQEAHLRVLMVPSCGWSDLGTPKRIMSVLQRLTGKELGETRIREGQAASLGVAAQLAQKHASLI
jgi:mannose-1-phosphate guanylyltransferase